MRKILGLDLGSNSIGWALIDDENKKILGAGVRIFPMGIINPGQGEKELSKNAQRSGSRGTRRQHFRKRLRMKILLQTLSEYDMCPLSPADIKEWKQTNSFPSEKLKDWFALNPYELRAKAIKERIELRELGRVFYHLIQRRGFQSNSRSASSEKSKI